MRMCVLFAAFVSVLVLNGINGKHLLQELQEKVMSENSQRGKDEKIASTKSILIKDKMWDATTSTKP